MMMTDADPDLIYLPTHELTTYYHVDSFTVPRTFHHRWDPLDARSTRLTLTDATRRVKSLELPAQPSRTAGGTNSLHSAWLTAPNVNM